MRPVRERAAEEKWNEEKNGKSINNDRKYCGCNHVIHIDMRYAYVVAGGSSTEIELWRHITRIYGNGNVSRL